MARKKKQKQVIVNESTPIKYEGTVTIKKIKNGKVTSTTKTHNSGYTSLFKFLLNCLCGNFDKNEAPGWAVPVIDNSGTKKYVGTCENISAADVVNKVNDEFFVEYKFYFPWTSEYSEGFDHIYVYPNNDTKHPTGNLSNIDIDDYNNYLDMSIDVTRETTTTLNEDILIIWQLQLINK